jgi:predicted DNA-binding helix-hairpin-helix protein
VDRILAIRPWHRIGVEDLVRLRVPVARVLPFVELAGHVPREAVAGGRVVDAGARSARQLDLFAA